MEQELKNEDFKSIEHKNIFYFQSNLLNKEGFSHGFFTRHWSEEDVKRFISNIQSNITLHRMNQVHSSNIGIASQETLENNLDIDCLISLRPDQALMVYSADCIPILIGDRNTGNVASLHAGWRGLRKSILSKTLKELIENGATISSLVVALGPAISGKNYEVNIDTASAISKSLYLKKKLSINKSEFNEARFLCEPPFRYPNKNKIFLDIRDAAIIQLKDHELDSRQIESTRICTFDAAESFYSWRRDQVRLTQWSFIASKK